MLNWAARYFPILRILRQHLDLSDSLLEIGSGPVGIGKFYSAPFVGCDVGFQWKPQAPMSPVLASAAQLPFDDQSFEGVLASDVLEHVPPEKRRAVVQEAIRVARKLVIFGFPSGSPAFAADSKLARKYQRKNRGMPEWLHEHMLYPFPTELLFQDLPRDWIVTVFSNENVDFHYWMMRREMTGVWDRFFSLLLTVSPRMVETVLKRADREPCYRRIVVIRREAKSDPVAAEC